MLLVDRELVMVRAYARALAVEGYEVATATDGEGAKASCAERAFDIVISGTDLPGASGLDLLRTLRRRDSEVRVILMSDEPAEDLAAQAAEQGALLFLVKPVDVRALLQITAHAVQLRRLSRARRAGLDDPAERDEPAVERARLAARLDAALPRMWIGFQPIVRAPSGTIEGYEALLRSDDESLPNPAAIFAAAERLGRVCELGRALRRRVAAAMAEAPPSALVFVNVHVDELNDPELGAGDDPLRPYASRVVLEITERASIGTIQGLRARLVGLRAAGFRVAIDDLGAGYAGLSSFAQLQPEVVKLDMSLVRGLDRDPMKRKLVRSVVSLCRELEVQTVAEGVETVAESRTLSDLSCSLQQGYLFAKAQRGFIRRVTSLP